MAKQFKKSDFEKSHGGNETCMQIMALYGNNTSNTAYTTGILYIYIERAINKS